jgi:hypothetical protein
MAANVQERKVLGKLMSARPDNQDLRLSEMLILAFLWMIFGFMLWYYLSAFHGTPVRLIANEILSGLLGNDFLNIIPNPDYHYLFQVQTRIPFEFPDGSREALGFIVNPLIFGFGLPLLFGLVMASGEALGVAGGLYLHHAGAGLGGGLADLEDAGIQFWPGCQANGHRFGYFRGNDRPVLPVGRFDFSAAGTGCIVGIDQLGIGGTVYRLAEEWSFPKGGN